MNQTYLSKILKVITILIGLIGLVVYIVALPRIGSEWAVDEYRSWYWPWLIFLWITAIPCLIGLLQFWNICVDIERDASFSEKNGLRLKRISLLAIVDVLYFFVGNVGLLLLNMSHPGIFLFSLILDFVGIAVGIAAALLSHLVAKAAILQKESELTI